MACITFTEDCYNHKECMETLKESQQQEPPLDIFDCGCELMTSTKINVHPNCKLHIQQKETSASSTDKQEWWRKDFNDFYFEQGKYEGRKTGIDGYLDFISHVASEERRRVLEEVFEFVKYNFSNDEKLAKSCRKQIVGFLEQKLNK